MRIEKVTEVWVEKVFVETKLWIYANVQESNEERERKVDEEMNYALLPLQRHFHLLLVS
jgi:hypothetical protein